MKPWFENSRVNLRECFFARSALIRIKFKSCQVGGYLTHFYFRVPKWRGFHCDGIRDTLALHL